MKKVLIDEKNKLSYFIFSRLNSIVVRKKFPTINVQASGTLPAGPLLLVSNHTARWDGLLMYYLLGRPANFLVSPNELKGLQGAILRSMGAFPASTTFDLQAHVQRQLAKGEPVVIFPEGDIYRDGKTHAFKSGTARLALACARAGISVPIIPTAVTYGKNGNDAMVAIGAPVQVESFLADASDGQNQVRALTDRLFREVCHLRYALGSRADQIELFIGNGTRSWVHPSPA